MEPKQCALQDASDPRMPWIQSCKGIYFLRVCSQVKVRACSPFDVLNLFESRVCVQRSTTSFVSGDIVNSFEMGVSIQLIQQHVIFLMS